MLVEYNIHKNLKLYGVLTNETCRIKLADKHEVGMVVLRKVMHVCECKR